MFFGLSFINGYAKNDFFSVAFPDQFGFQTCRYDLSLQQQPILMDEYSVFPYLPQHIFFRENTQMSFYIIRGNGFRSIAHNIAEEIVPLLCQTETLIFL